LIEFEDVASINHFLCWEMKGDAELCATIIVADNI